MGPISKHNELAAGTRRLPIESVWFGVTTMNGSAILVVEDHYASRRLISALLQGEGYEVIEAADGLEGHDLYRQYQSDIAAIILDLDLPLISGSELYDLIRRDDTSLPVIVVTAHSDFPQTDPKRRIIPHGFLQKPYSPDCLLVLVRAVLARSPSFARRH